MPGTSASKLASLTKNRNAASLVPPEISGADTSKREAKTRRRQNLNVTPRCRDLHTIRCPTTVRASENHKRFCVITRYLRDEYDASNGHGCIGVALKGGIPEILRVALGAGKEPDARRTWIRCKSQREGELDRRAVRALALALELVKLIISDAGRAKSICVRGAAPFKHQHRKSLPAHKPIAVKGSEREMSGQMRGNPRRISYGQ